MFILQSGTIIVALMRSLNILYKIKRYETIPKWIAVKESLTHGPQSILIQELKTIKGKNLFKHPWMAKNQMYGTEKKSFSSIEENSFEATWEKTNSIATSSAKRRKSKTILVEKKQYEIDASSIEPLACQLNQRCPLRSGAP